MITRQPAFLTSDGTTHSNLEDAQKHEMHLLIESKLETAPTPLEEAAIKLAAEIIIKNSAAALDILTTTPTSKPRARRANGGTKKRTKPAELQLEPEKAA